MNFSQQKAIDTILEERLALLPEEITQLISNTQFKQEVEILIDDLPLEPTQKKELSNFFYMTLLLFVPIDTFIDTLIQKTTIPTDIAQLSYNKLYALIPPEIQDILQAITDELKKEPENTLQTLQETFTPEKEAPASPAPATHSTNTPSAPAPDTNITTPPPLEATTPVQAMRTMETDMNRIHGYGAYRAQFPEIEKEQEETEEIIRSATQEELLLKKPSLANTPTYEEDNDGDIQKT